MNHSMASAGIKLNTKSGSHKDDTKTIYNILFSEDERLSKTDIDDNNFTKYNEKPTFGEVTTLDWLKTWRDFKIN